MSLPSWCRFLSSRSSIFSARLPGCLRALSRTRSEEHTSELQSHSDIVCRLLLEKKKIASMTQKLTLSVISDDANNDLDKARMTTACLRIKSNSTAGGKRETSTYPSVARVTLTQR